MNKDIKLKIEKIVKGYAKAYPDEFEAFKKGVKQKLYIQRDKFASTKNMDFVIRGLYEIPETLLGLLKLKLTMDEWKFYESKEGGRWFAKKFKEFAIAEKI